MSLLHNRATAAGKSPGQYMTSKYTSWSMRDLNDASQHFLFPEIFDRPVDAMEHALREMYRRGRNSFFSQRLELEFIKVRNLDTMEVFWAEVHIEEEGTGYEFSLYEDDGNYGNVIHKFYVED